MFLKLLRVSWHTLHELTLVETAEETVLPPSSSSEYPLDIPESVDTESAAVPEYPFAVVFKDVWLAGGLFEQLYSK